MWSVFDWNSSIAMSITLTVWDLMHSNFDRVCWLEKYKTASFVFV